MYCKKCGNPVSEDTKFCNQCGNNIIKDNYDFNNKKIVCLFICICGLLLIVIGLILYNNQNSNYYFSEVTENPTPELPKKEKEEENITEKKKKYKTSIIYDNVYYGADVGNEEEAIKLIETDSTKQKNACPKEMITIENRIIKNYGISAVNLCELDLDFAKEIEQVFEKIYKEYPKVKGYLTNMTVVNAPIQEGYIAAFMPYFAFASDKNTNKEVIKTQVLLNTTYFFNEKKLESSVQSSSIQGWFPKNATRSSPVAHELGHYLSFLAMMHYYNLDSFLIQTEDNYNQYINIMTAFSDGSFSLKMIEEAYNNYKKDHKNYTGSLDEFRGTISQYALAKDKEGNYIYDETIAEAFHDCYLNKNNAVDASKYIEKVLKSYINRIGE